MGSKGPAGTGFCASCQQHSNHPSMSQKPSKQESSTKKVSEKYNNWTKDQLIDEVDRLSKHKKYGLVWEDKPEDVVELCKTNIPVLKEIKSREIITDESKLVNILIEGDNYHSLSVLNYTHAGKIDVIYIDPPYNTGSTTWRYNNDYIDKDDGYRHSKFITFIKNRLNLAKSLLKDNGYFICAIDHNELFTLGLLFDEYFGEENRLGLVTVLHNPKGRNFTKFFSANSEYMLVYSKNSSLAEFNSVAIDEEVMASFDMKDNDGKRYRLEPYMRCRTETLRINKPDFYYPIYYNKKNERFSLSPSSDSIKLLPTSNNGREFSWINLPDTFLEKNKEFVVEHLDGRYQLFRKFYEQQIYKNVWTNKKYFSEFNGSNLIRDILGNKIFDYPKSIYLLEDILKITSKRDSIILDFFAGSGTTGHAVMELNKLDGGNRQFILCTNNENNICEDVTNERIKRVIRGYKNNKGKVIKGIGGNLKYYKTILIPKSYNRDEMKIRITEECTEMLCIREGIYEEIRNKSAYKIFKQGKKIMAVYYFLSQKELPALKKELDKMEGEKILYCFTLDSLGLNESDFEDWKEVRLEPIPQKILDIYKEIHEY